ncbi:hypothetical protein [Larkinella knui]|uniref:Outer membrane protein beta-barrel domain-containing protein n=1 Tax=Larkinella knui TaxID=2025310 RepID=A0A3P1CEC7_9BACT|nr:hypothetical protein [Larkinella knui]RRB11608.1 hypothetical protein EHT87_24360 [Larkinella knui]
MKKRILFSVIGLIWALGAMAQTDAEQEDQSKSFTNSLYERFVSGRATVFYGVGLPMGSQQNYMDKVGTRNFAVAIEAMFPGRFSVGGRIGQQYSSERLPRQTYTFDDGSEVSAVQTRALTVVPLLAIGSVYLNDITAVVRPYVQLGAGGAYVDYAKYYGTLVDQKTGVRGALAPAVGAKFQFGKNNNLGGEIQAQYQHVFFKYNELKNSSNLLFSVGLSYRWL